MYLIGTLLNLYVSHILSLNLLNHGKYLNLIILSPQIPVQSDRCIGIGVFLSLFIPGHFFIIDILPDILAVSDGFAIVITEYDAVESFSDVIAVLPGYNFLFRILKIILRILRTHHG